MDLTNFLIKASLTNPDTKGQIQRKLQTNDYVFLQTFEEAQESNLFTTFPASTNYAEYNGNFATHHSLNFLKKPIGWYWLRTNNFDGCTGYVGFYGNTQLESQFVDFTYTGIRPKIRLDINKVITKTNSEPDYFNITAVYDDDGNICYHTLEFGYYPQQSVCQQLSETLSELLEQGKLEKTGKSYLGKLIDKEFVKNEEYIYNNEKYVLTNINCYNNELFTMGSLVKTKYGYSTDSNYQKVSPNEKRWVKVEKIKWIIENYNNLPKKLNADGDGSANYISLISEDVLLSGIPYNFNHENKNSELWKFCIVRAYLNGLDMYKDKHDISLDFIYNFTHLNFINEAFKN